MPPRILVADDDPHIREVISFALARAGMAVHAVADGEAALQAFGREPPDLVVLDVGMPEMDGLEVCRELRKRSDVPILFLSARNEEIDRVLGLEMGGDDYVTKPFSPRELVARVHVILRRARPPAPVPAPEAPLRHGRLALDAGSRIVTLGEREIPLTAAEFGLLRKLLERPAHVLSRAQLMAAREGGIHVSDRTIDSHVRNIRAKFAAAGCDDVVETVHGVGFRLGRCGA